MADFTVEVIDCLACSNKVSVLAEKCPSCGNPIQWTHPKILEFINIKDTGLCNKEFNFEYKASYGFYKMKLGNKDTFEADLLSGKWESTNDNLFFKVREFLLS